MVIAFEKIGGVDIAFFSFIVQEYYSNCPGPNRNCVYLAYLDSVQAFQPHELRTQVYHTILLAYFKYVKLLGFKCVYIWACPPGPSSGYDYIFYSHPPAMKMPTLKRLKAWYTNLLRIGQGKGIITGHSVSYVRQKDDWWVSIEVIIFYLCVRRTCWLTQWRTILLGLQT